MIYANLSNRELNRLAKKAVKKSSEVSGGTLHIYKQRKSFYLLTGGDHIPGDDGYIGYLIVKQEHKPYTKEDFITQINQMYNNT